MGLHAHAVAQQGAACERARGVYGKYPDRTALRSIAGRQPIDEGTLSRAWRSRDTDDVRSSRCMKEGTDEPGRTVWLVLDEGDGARQGAHVAVQHSPGQ